jgi:CHAT domain-containing protein/tetratricopeptide (TPR) repeat protein
VLSLAYLSEPITNPHQSASGQTVLTVGTPITSEISGNKTARFELSAASRQYDHISIEKGDLRLSLAIYDPENNKVIQVTSDRYETLETSFISRAAGNFRLEIRSLEGTQIARRFQIKVDPPRPAVAKDLKEAAAQQMIASASQLRSEWTSTSLRKAIANYSAARSLWQSIGKWREAAIAALSAAEIHFALGEYRQSLSWSQYAASDFRTRDDRLGESRALSRSGQMYSLLGDNKQGRSLSRKALDYYSASGLNRLTNPLKQLYSEALTNAGEVNYAIGDLVSASDCFEKSLRLFLEVGDRGGEARSRLFLGYISATIGDTAGAKKQFEQSLELSREIGNQMAEALSLTAIGIANSLERNEEVAIKMHRNAMEIFRLIGDGQSEAVTLTGIGQAYQNLNEDQAALVHYRQALKLFEENGNLDFASVALYQIAKVYESDGDAKQAEAFYTRCLNVSRAAQKKRMLAYALNDLAALHMSQGRRQKAVTEYRKVLRFYESINDRRGQALTLNNIGDFYLAVGNKSQALFAYKRALPLSRQGGERGVEISTLYNLARVEQALGALQQALTTVKASIDIIEKLRSNVASPDFRFSYFSSQRKHYDLFIDLLMQLDQEQPGKDFAATALLASENARARSLCEILAEAGTDIRQGVKPEILKRERELQHLLRAAAEYQSELGQSNESYALEVAPKVDLLRTEYEEIQALLREHNPRYEALTHPKALSIADIQAQLRDDNTILLEYALGDERSYLWSVTANSLKGYILPGKASLETTAREVYGMLTGRQLINGKVDDGYQARVDAGDKQYYQKALSLSRMLLQPVAHELGNKRLIIVSDGVLQYLPFDALPIPDAGNEQVSESIGDSLLISRHEVVNLPSISALAAIRAGSRRLASSKRTVAVFADPVFSRFDERVTPDKGKAPSVQTDTSGGFRTNGPTRLSANGLIRLAHTSEEADAIATTAPWGTWVAKGFAANRENVLTSQLAQYKIVHFATHGIINTEHPELSGIVLSMETPDGSPENGYLQLHDIYSLNLSADLTVLSACDTALGKDVKGEGLIGLTRGFMYAGSRSVVASLWKVDDHATALLMKHFYRKMLHEGLPPAAALRSAKEIVRKEPAWNAPYFWAGFVIQGEYLEPIEVDHNPWLQSVAVVLSSLLFVVAAFILVKRYRRTAPTDQKHA